MRTSAWNHRADFEPTNRCLQGSGQGRQSCCASEACKGSCHVGVSDEADQQFNLNKSFVGRRLRGQKHRRPDRTRREAPGTTFRNVAAISDGRRTRSYPPRHDQGDPWISNGNGVELPNPGLARRPDRPTRSGYVSGSSPCPGLRMREMSLHLIQEVNLRPCWPIMMSQTPGFIPYIKLFQRDTK